MNAPATLVKVEDALRYIGAYERKTWIAVGMAMKAEFGDAGLECWLTWSQAADNYNERDALSSWRSFASDGKVTIATVFYLAGQAGWQPERTPARPAKPSPVHRDDRRRVQRHDPRPAHRHETIAPQWGAFWNSCTPIAGTPVETYLRHRGCRIPPIDGDLKFRCDVLHWPSKTRHPCMVALITHVITCQPLSLHFTFLAPEGRCKANVEKAKLLLPRHNKRSGVIRLWPDEAVTYSLGIAEGIESALSLAHAHTPVWAAIDAGNLGSLPPLPGIETVVLAADHDDAGKKAAQKFADAWAAAGKDVRLVMPPTAGNDFNDVVLAA